MPKDLKYLLITSIISSDNDEFTEDTKQAIISRLDLKEPLEDIDWEYVLEPIEDEEKRYKLIDLLKQ